MTNLNIRSKILVSLLAISLIPILFITVIAVTITRDAVSKRAFSQLANVREVKKNQVLTFVRERETGLRILLETVDGLKQAAFNKLRAIQENKKAQIQRYFIDIAKDVLVIAESAVVVKALSDFRSTIDQNGQVDQVLHEFFLNEKYGRSLFKLSDMYGYHNMMLITDHGRIAFSSNKAVPVGKSVYDELFHGAGIAECFEAAKTGLEYRDYAPYPPENNIHLAFLGSPIRDRNGAVSGVMVVFLSNQGINEITLRRQGMGTTGETYLTIRQEDGFILRSRRRVSGENIGDRLPITGTIKKLSKKQAPRIEIDETGTPEISIHDTLHILGTTYYLFSHLALREVIDPRSEKKDTDYFLNYLESYGYQNLYLISPQGRIFFSAIDDDSVEQVRLDDKDSGLSKLYLKIMDTQDRAFVDFSLTDDRSRPFAYIGAPLKTGHHQVEMIVALKLSYEEMNRIMQTSRGMAESLDVYLVGPDLLMRSDSYLLPEQYSVDQSFRSPDTHRVDTIAVRNALNGFSSQQELVDYRDVTVLSSYSPIDIMGTTWAVIAEIDKTEAFEFLRTLLILIIFSGVITAAIIFFLSLYLAERFSSPIRHLTAAAESIQAREFDIEIDVRTGDEFKTLGTAFNDMATTIREYALDLEQKIVQLEIAQKETRESEERFRSLVETTSDWIWEVNAQGVYTYVSPRIHAILGYTPEEIIGKTPFDLMPDTEKDRISKVFTGIIESRQPFSSLENTNRHKNGHLVILETSGIPFFDDADELLGYRGIDRDVTQRKRYEEALLLTESVFTNTIEGIAITDKNGTIQRVNQAFCDITGYSGAEAVGQNPRILKSDRHDDAFYQEMWRDLLEKGQWSGEIWNRRKDGSAYPEWLSISSITDSSGEITNFISLFHDVSEKKNKEEQLQFLAYHDPLTKLPNRTLLYDRIKVALRNAKRNNSKLALLYMDIDNFKNINDSYGHPFGDEFLCRVKDRIKSVCRETDTFARYGGDEFVIVLNNVTDSRHVIDFSNRIISLFETPLTIFEEEVYSSVSIGLAVYPDDGDDIVTLEKNADMALYEAKKYGKQQAFMFKQTLKDKMLRKTHLENEMRRSVSDYACFYVMYQPKVDTDNHRIYSVEALLRWTVDERAVSPMEFIPIAEENNLIIPIGEWLMERTMHDIGSIHQAGFNDISMAINLSSKQFNDLDLLRKIEDKLEQTGFDPLKLCFEITESIPMQNTKQAIAIMEKINAMGIKLSMDDFGTGYSSLSALKQFPLTEIKIDRAFVRDLPENANDAAISRTIIQMAESLNFEVVAEGVETAEQLDFLKENGCRRIQGYYFYKPMLIDDLMKALGAHTISA
ncbi:MAG: EAL domain-containing protein [Desulfobacteraceae bacterium]|nr:MAG: EAL domain-containing protein [Desulfobacteraceae bacterium]